MANKRIKDLTEKNVLASGDYFPIDNSTDGTKKVNASKILDPISHVQGEVSGAGDSYSSSKSYAKGDLVIHDNVLYVCTSACTSGSWATNSSHFTATTLASEVTDVKQTLTIENISSIFFTKDSDDFEVLEPHVFKQGRHIFGSFTISKTSAFGTSQTIIGTLKYAPVSSVNSFCALGNNRFDPPTKFGYLWLNTGVGGQNGPVYIKAPDGTSTSAKINLDYVTV